jgi:hypothetical protein
MERRILSYRLFEEQTIQDLTEKQIKWLNQCTRGRWELNPETGLIDVLGSFDCYQQDLRDLNGIKFGTVSGYFYCDHNSITSLEGSPIKTGGNFYCNNNQLNSLEGAPKEVDGSFYCLNNRLASLNGAPEKIRKSFDCGENNLVDLKGAPKEVGSDFYCDKNMLISLDGAPEEVGGSFSCDDNPVSGDTLRAIYDLMKSGRSYPEALSQYWREIPDDDRFLMYKDNPNLSADEIKGYELRNKAAKRIY